MRVLVIDDDANIRSGLRRLLVAKYRAEVIEASDGVVGCQRLLEDPCDLVLLDLHMRRMDGMDTLRAIRRSPKHGSVPVMMLTGDSDVSVVVSAKALGVEDFLIKPVDATILFERIDAALARAAKENSQDAPVEVPVLPPVLKPPPLKVSRILSDCVKIRLQT